jgi:hypothetical protein
MSQTHLTVLIYTISEKGPLKLNGRLLPSSLHPSPHFVFSFILFEPTPFLSSLLSVLRHKSELSYFFILQMEHFRAYSCHVCKKAYVKTACSHINGVITIQNTQCIIIVFLLCKTYTAGYGYIEAKYIFFPKTS